MIKLENLQVLVKTTTPQNVDCARLQHPPLCISRSTPTPSAASCLSTHSWPPLSTHYALRSLLRSTQWRHPRSLVHSHSYLNRKVRARSEHAITMVYTNLCVGGNTRTPSTPSKCAATCVFEVLKRHLTITSVCTSDPNDLKVA